jgi:parvulin-like peptidyl-prolyl isomerase
VKKGAWWALVVVALVAVIAVVVLAGKTFRRPSGEVLARVGSEPITTDSFREEWRKQFAAPSGLPPAGVEEFLGDMVVEKLFLAEAKRQRLHRDPRFLREVESYREQLLVEMLLNKEVLAIAPPSSADVEAFWKNHAADFHVPELVRLSHILIQPKAGEDAAALRARAQETVDQIEGEEDFARLAASSADREAAGQGPDLGYFRRVQLAQWSPEIEKAVWELPVGKTAGPIATDRGCHIFLVTDRKAPREKTLDEARDEVKAAIMAARRKERFDALEARLRNRTSIERNEQILNALRGELKAPARPPK